MRVAVLAHVVVCITDDVRGTDDLHELLTVMALDEGAALSHCYTLEATGSLIH